MKKEGLLLITYWIAALADFVIAIRVLIPTIIGIEPYGYPIGIVASVGISWGILLIYATKSPVERKWILLPTILVMLLITIVFIHATISDHISFPLGIFSSVSGILILVFSCYSYRRNK